jgi:uncharacterized protein YfdQ (DUF2303 family)
MQSIEASSKDVMPVAFEFKCVPYEGLGERRFSLRNSLLKSSDRYSFCVLSNWKPRKKRSPMSSAIC